MSNEKLFCPEFVYEICVGLTVYDFVFKDLTLSMNAKQFSNKHTRTVERKGFLKFINPYEFKFLFNQDKFNLSNS